MFLASCHDPLKPGTGEDGPGFVVLSVSSPFGDARAVRFDLRGPGVDSVQSTHTMFASPVASSLYRAIVVGAVGSGDIVRFWVPDRTVLDDYRVDVLEVASGTTYSQLDPAQYSVSIEPESD
jgi:hypothetical protein